MSDVLTEDHKEFVVERAAKGYDAREIRYMLRDEFDLELSPSRKTIAEFIESDNGQERIETIISIREKKAQISKEDLVETLVTLKEDLESWHDELKGTEHGVTRNEAIKNIIDTVNKIGELIGELEHTQIQSNVVKVDEMNNYVEQNFTEVVQHLSKDDKEDIIQQLEDDPDVENFIIEMSDDGEERTEGRETEAAPASES